MKRQYFTTGSCRERRLLKLKLGGAMAEMYKQKHHGGPVADVGLGTYDAFDVLQRKVFAPGADLEVDRRQGSLDATIYGVKDTFNSAARFLFQPRHKLRNLGLTFGNAVFGITGGMIKDGKDAMLAKSWADARIVHDAPQSSVRSQEASLETDDIPDHQKVIPASLEQERHEAATRYVQEDVRHQIRQVHTDA